MTGFETTVEQAAIKWLGDLGYQFAYGNEIAPDGEFSERASYGQVILEDRLTMAVRRLNAHLPAEVQDDLVRRVIRAESPSLEEENLRFQRMLAKGVEVQVRREGGIRGDVAWLVDFQNPDNNDWLAVNQFTVIEGKYNRRPDIVVFLNGLPISVIELKDPQNPQATMKSAWNQIQTYKAQIPSLFNTNQVLLISDGIEAKIGSLTAGFERFGPWRTIDGHDLAPGATPKLQVVLEGLFDKRLKLDR